MIENRAITAFAKNLEAQNLEGLKAISSDDFNQRALRTASSLEDLKILRIPDISIWDIRLAIQRSCIDESQFFAKDFNHDIDDDGK